jgi:hypothetical protein
VGGDLLRAQVGGAGGGGVLRVGVRGVQAGGAGAQRAVGEEVARGPGGAEFADPLGILRTRDEFAPVAGDAGAGLGGGEREQSGEVLLAGDVGSGALVHGADAQRGGAAERGPLGTGAIGGAEGVVGGAPHRVVGLARERGVGVVAGQVPHARDEVEQCRGGQRGVRVDAAEVEGAAFGGAVQLRAAGRASLRPVRGVPAVPRQHAGGGAGPGVVRDARQRPGQRADG